MATPEIKAAMKKLGFEPKVGSPQEFAEFIRDEIDAGRPLQRQPAYFLNEHSSARTRSAM